MKTTRLMVVLILIAGGGRAVAAQSGETRQVDKRVIVSTNATAGVSATRTREPVTFLGVAVAPAAPVLAAQLRLPEGQGLVVILVEPDSPAARAGLREHDVLTKLDDQILIDPRQLSVLVRNRKEGDKVTVTYVRAGAEARTPATLATHVPGPESGFQWHGGRSADVFFHTENFEPAAGFEFGPPGAANVVPFQRNIPNAGRPPAHVGPNTDRVMIFRPQAGVVFSDETGSLEMRVDERRQNLTAKNVQGEAVFSGPVNTPEERAALPADLRKRLEILEALDVFETSAPPPQGNGFTPGERQDVSPPVL